MCLDSEWIKNAPKEKYLTVACISCNAFSLSIMAKILRDVQIKVVNKDSEEP
jgi:hypothetical protein